MNLWNYHFSIYTNQRTYFKDNIEEHEDSNTTIDENIYFFNGKDKQQITENTSQNGKQIADNSQKKSSNMAQVKEGLKKTGKFIYNVSHKTISSFENVVKNLINKFKQETTAEELTKTSASINKLYVNIQETMEHVSKNVKNENRKREIIRKLVGVSEILFNIFSIELPLKITQIQDEEKKQIENYVKNLNTDRSLLISAFTSFVKHDVANGINAYEETIENGIISHMNKIKREEQILKISIASIKEDKQEIQEINKKIENNKLQAYKDQEVKSDIEIKRKKMEELKERLKNNEEQKENSTITLNREKNELLELQAKKKLILKQRNSITKITNSLEKKHTQLYVQEKKGRTITHTTNDISKKIKEITNKKKLDSLVEKSKAPLQNQIEKNKKKNIKRSQTMKLATVAGASATVAAGASFGVEKLLNSRDNVDINNSSQSITNEEPETTDMLNTENKSIDSSNKATVDNNTSETSEPSDSKSVNLEDTQSVKSEE